MYKQFIKPILFQFDPEKVHNFFTDFGELLGNSGLGRRAVGLAYGYKGPNISVKIDGLNYRTPFVLSAGFDHNARLTRILPSIGLGGVEVGSITAKPCAGNPHPWLKRLPKSRSILVNKGLYNDGVETIINRIKKRPRTNDFVVGVSIAKTNDANTVSVQDGVADYFYSYRRLNESDIGDYYTINISCPNAFGGETFTDPEHLDILLEKLREIKSRKPLYIKMPINLPWEKTDELISIGLKYEINGVIIGNLNKNYDDLKVRQEAPEDYRGGLSGLPCFSLSNELIKKASEKYADRLTIVGCGGVMSQNDARLKFEAGAKLIHLITGIIYEGPALVKKLAVSVLK